MRVKRVLLHLQFLFLLFSCTIPSENEDSLNYNYQIEILIPDSLLNSSDLSIRDILTKKEADSIDLWMTTELYEMNGSQKSIVANYQRRFDFNTQTLNSFSLKSNTDYLLLYFLEFKRCEESFYQFVDLTNVKLLRDENTMDIGAYKEIFVGRKELKGGSKVFCDTIILQSPFSLYELQATDLSSFLEAYQGSKPDSIDVCIKYNSFYPSVYDISFLRPIKSEIGVQFTRRVPLQSDYKGFLYLGHDYLFMGEQRAFASIEIQIIHPSTLKLLSTARLQFDYYIQNRKVLAGDFLTRKQDGVIIDTTFQDDIIIEF